MIWYDLKGFRQAFNLTQKQLAEILKCQQSNISGMEKTMRDLEPIQKKRLDKPKVERIKGASPAILISQTDNNKNPRSTVGTMMTDIYTDLAHGCIEKLGIRNCPCCGELISAADCLEETEKKGNDFHVDTVLL